MRSKLLESQGLLTYISRKKFSMSYKKEGNKVKHYVLDMCNDLGSVPKMIYTGYQEHSLNIQYCDGENGEDFVYGKIFYNTDGLITDKKQVALLVKFADCSPVVLYDPKKGVLALVHSGWRGTAGKIAALALDRMVKDFSSSPEDVYAYIGPSIDQESYEVGPEVYQAFEGFAKRDDFFYKKGDKYHLDLLEANESILLEGGLKKEKIEICPVSTYRSKDFHSARRDGADYGLNSMIVMMKD